MKIHMPRTLINDRYEVAGSPMVGGMGIVYPCFDHQEDRPVALKTLQPIYLSSAENIERFISECGIWVSLGHHTNIVTAFSVERAEDRGELYLALDLIVKDPARKDASLKSWMVPNSSMPLETVLSYAIQIARGMNYATSIVPGLLHRDLKPENILISLDRLGNDSNNQVMVSDFGLAHVLGSVTNLEKVKENNTIDFDKKEGRYKILGTPLYMSPEQWTGERLDINTDIYAFGCMLFEMISGYPLVQGRSIAELCKSHCNQEFQDWPHSIPAIIQDFVGHCVRLKSNYEGWKTVEAELMNIYNDIFHKAVSVPSLVAEDDESNTIGMSFNYLGFSMFELGEKDKALEYIERANRICQKTKDEILQTAVLNSQGMVEMEYGSLKRAADMLEQAVELVQHSSNRANQARLIGNLAQAHFLQNNLNYAIQLHEKTLQIAREISNFDLEAGELINLGNCYEHLGDLNKALEFHEKGLEIASKIENWRWVANALCNMGICLNKIGDPKRAIEYYEESNRVNKQYAPDKNGEAGTLINMGQAYLRLGDPANAIKSLREGLSLSREIRNQMWEANALANISLSYQLTGDLEQAIKYIQESLTIRKKIGDPRGLCNDSANLGNLYFLEGKSDKAIEYLESSAALAKKINYPLGLALSCHMLTVVLSSAGRISDALTFAATALELYASMHHPNLDNLQRLILEIKSKR